VEIDKFFHLFTKRDKNSKLSFSSSLAGFAGTLAILRHLKEHFFLAGAAGWQKDCLSACGPLPWLQEFLFVF
jgi:hypothetical protein